MRDLLIMQDEYFHLILARRQQEEAKERAQAPAGRSLALQEKNHGPT